MSARPKGNSESIWSISSVWFIWLVSSNQTDQKDQTDQIDRQVYAHRASQPPKMVVDFSTGWWI
jgi:hypothetical protein